MKYEIKKSYFGYVVINQATGLMQSMWKVWADAAKACADLNRGK